jgi:hypothetical protein
MQRYTGFFAECQRLLRRGGKCVILYILFFDIIYIILYDITPHVHIALQSFVHICKRRCVFLSCNKAAVSDAIKATLPHWRVFPPYLPPCVC